MLRDQILSFTAAEHRRLHAMKELLTERGLVRHQQHGFWIIALNES
jgi:hypothetical protein